MFCQIASGEAEADIVYQDDNVVAFRDLAPQAPEHVLVIPRQHVASAAEVEDPTLWGTLMDAVVRVAREMGMERRGYRIVVNCGREACQTVHHLHVHLLSGRPFSWPPG